MSDGTVTFTLSAFKRAGFVGRGGLIQLIGTGEDSAAVEELSQAAQECTGHFNDAVREEIFIRVNGAVPAANGPVALMTECEPARALPLALEFLAERLSARGVTGELKPAKSPRPGIIESKNTNFPALTAYLDVPVETARITRNYAPDIHAPRTRNPFAAWYGSPEATAACVEATVAWAIAEPGTTTVWSGATRFAMEPSAVAAFITTALPDEFMLTVKQEARDGSWLRTVSFDH